MFCRTFVLFEKGKEPVFYDVFPVMSFHIFIFSFS